jgi:small GTP-binding protein
MASSVFLPPAQTRLVTICAHVDHGKTTLADNLIEANGIISERLAGTLRYLDSLEEEQRRGITMRASAIGLRHVYRSPKKEIAPTNVVVHLLDSPGHTDFSTEVSSSLQCCDGCLLVVDAVEGMCARTHQVVREAHHHQLVPVLVINKVDRLCTNLCLSPTEAYLRLRSLIESVNAACSAMLTSSHAEQTANSDTTLRSSRQADETELQQWTFEPAKGNVIFASALYGWGFTVPSLSRSLFRQKVLPIKPMLLKQYLFGDFKYKAENQKVLKWKPDHANNSEEPMFAEFGLKTLWELYEGIATASSACGAGSSLFADGRIVNSSNKAGKHVHTKITATTPGMDQVLATLQTGTTANYQSPPTTIDELQAILTRTGASNEDAVLRSILRRYRPLSEIVLDTVYDICPSPSQASSTVRPRALAFTPPHPESFRPIQTAVQECDSSPTAPTVAHICKFMATNRSHIRDPKLIGEDASSSSSSDSVILGLARVLSGSLRTGDDYFVFGPKHVSGQAAPKRTIRLYLLMGSEFVLVNEVPAGHLCAIQNLEDVQLKTATLCSSPEGRPLMGFDRGIRPLVKVNVESVDPADTPILERGLVKLSLADAAVEVTATAKGERLLACLGELHLEQSILDLKRVYCGKDTMELRISDPIVEFGETTEWFEHETADFGAFWAAGASAAPLRQTKIPPYNEEEGLEHAHRGRSRTILTGRLGAISLRAVPLKDTVFRALKEKNVVEGCEEDILQLGKALGMEESSSEEVLASLVESLCSIDKGGSAMVESATLRKGATVRGVESTKGEIYVPPKTSIVAGDSNPHEEGDAPAPEIESSMDDYVAVKEKIHALGFSKEENEAEEPSSATSSANEGALAIWNSQIRGSLVAGFRMALRAGPICEEPLRGILVVLEGVEVAVQSSPTESDGEASYSCAKHLSGGMVVSALRSGIRCALL